MTTQVRAAAAAAMAVAVLTSCSDLNSQDDFRTTAAKADKVLTVVPSSDTRIFQPSQRAGGVLRLATSAQWPSMDPAATVQPEARNFLRNYARTLTVFRAAPADVTAGGMVVPDLAAALGTSSNDAKTWSYTLRNGVKYEDGTTVTAGDIANGVQQSMAKAASPTGVDWFKGSLVSVSAPDSRTVVFVLKRPVRNFDEFAQLPVTSPVPRAQSSTRKVVGGVLATGPYKIASVKGANYRLVRNDQYDAGTDPQSKRAALADEIIVETAVPEADLSRRLADGTLDMQIGAVRGDVNRIQGQSIGQRVPGHPTDVVVLPSVAFTAINAAVEPFGNEDCRRAVVLAADRSGYHEAYGGAEVAQPATGLLPAADSAALPKDLLKLAEMPLGDVVASQKALVGCKLPTGFRTILGYRKGEAADEAAAAVLKTSLARVGIIVQVKAFPAKALYSVAAEGGPFTLTNKIGLIMAAGVVPWPDGESLLRPVLDGSEVGLTANVDLRYLDVGRQLLTRESRNSEAAVRRGAWIRIDELAMLGSFAIPGVWGRNTLHRPTGVTNLVINDAFGLYDYVLLGKAYRS